MRTKADKAPLSPEERGRRRTLGIVFLTLFVDLVGFSIIFPLFPAMLDYYLPAGAGGDSLLGKLIAPLARWAESHGTGDPRFLTAVLFGGILGSLYSVLQFFFAPVWGKLSDRFGRRPVLLVSIAGVALSYAAWFFAASFWVLVAARTLGGVMGGNLSVATAAVADVTSRDKRAGGLALVGIAFGLGFIVGPAIGGLAANLDLAAMAPGLAEFGVNPFSMPALLAFALSVANLLWVAWRFGETLPPERRGNVANDERRGLQVFRLRRIASPEIRRTNGIYLLFVLAFSGIEFTLTFLAVERFAFSPAQNGGMFVFIGVILVFAQGFIVRRAAPKIGEKRLAIAGLAFGTASFALLAKAETLGLFFAGLALLSLSVGLASPTLNALVSLYSNEEDQGFHLGVFRSAGSLARAIGPLAAAFAYFAHGAAPAYALAACLLVPPLAVAFALPAPRKE